MERAIIICDTAQVLPQHFPSISPKGFSSADSSQIDFFDLKDLEKHTIIKALQRVNYNKAEAARLLNLEWNALYRRIQKYDISLPDDTN